MDPTILSLREYPALAEPAARWFHEKWGIPLSAYEESIARCLEGAQPVPQWFVATADGQIVGGLGVIENDFHDRADLTPNVCAVYVEEAFRCRGIAGALLGYACDTMQSLGVDGLYLLTDHTGFYERYGWEFLCMVQGDGDAEPSRMYFRQAPGTVCYRRLTAGDLSGGLFRDFRRHQVVTHCWRKEQGRWEVRPIAFTEEWSEEDYAFLVGCLQNTVATGGAVFGAFSGGMLKGFASVEAGKLGSRQQYRDLSALHVSEELRGKGIGRRFFNLAKDFARTSGGEKLYISAHSSVESQAFYKAMGCVEAAEYDPVHVAKEPCDCQLECWVSC